MVWGAVGWNYKFKLIFVEGTLNAKRYQDMLDQNHVIESMHRHSVEHLGGIGYFQQDGAPAHTAKKTVRWLKKKKNRIIVDWPANSPDLSVIETVWGILKLRIAMSGPKSVAELIEMLQDEWNKLEFEVINGLLASIPRRFQWCIEANGKSTGHVVRNNAHANASRGPSTLPDGILVVQ
jgi:transposase